MYLMSELKGWYIRTSGILSEVIILGAKMAEAQKLGTWNTIFAALRMRRGVVKVVVGVGVFLVSIVLPEKLSVMSRRGKF